MSASLHAALGPFFAVQPAPARKDVELLTEALVDFFAHRGFPVEEEKGERRLTAPVHALTPALAFSFVAAHCITRFSLPVQRLQRIGRLLKRAIEDAAKRGAIEAALARQLEHALKLSVAELPRLDAFARALKTWSQGDRPGRDLYNRDPAAYAKAMRAWELSRPVVTAELEGGFVVRTVGEDGLVLSHPAKDRALSIPAPIAVGKVAREGDRLDALLGKSSSQLEEGSRAESWFLLDSFSVAAAVPQIFTEPSSKDSS